MKMSIYSNSNANHCTFRDVFLGQCFHILNYHILTFYTSHLFVLPGVQAQLKFLTAWGRVLHGRLGRSVVLDCTTNDPNATVELFHMGRKLTVQPGVLTNVGGLFTIIKATVRSAGPYTCKAANQAGSPIQKFAPLILSHGELYMYQSYSSLNSCNTSSKYCA